MSIINRSFLEDPSGGWGRARALTTKLYIHTHTSLFLLSLSLFFIFLMLFPCRGQRGKRVYHKVRNRRFQMHCTGARVVVQGISLNICHIFGNRLVHFRYPIQSGIRICPFEMHALDRKHSTLSDNEHNARWRQLFFVHGQQPIDLRSTQTGHLFSLVCSHQSTLSCYVMHTRTPAHTRAQTHAQIYSCTYECIYPYAQQHKHSRVNVCVRDRECICM